MIVSANTVTIVIAISAIISPILVAIINNHHQAKMKKLEFKHQENLKNLEIKETHEKKLLIIFIPYMKVILKVQAVIFLIQPMIIRKLTVRTTLFLLCISHLKLTID